MAPLRWRFPPNFGTPWRLNTRPVAICRCASSTAPMHLSLRPRSSIMNKLLLAAAIVLTLAATSALAAEIVPVNFDDPGDGYNDTTPENGRASCRERDVQYV